MAARAERLRPGFRRFFTRSKRVGGDPAPTATAERHVESATLWLAVVVDAHDRDLLADMAASVRPHIAGWVVADVGADDASRRLIEEQFAGIAGQWMDLHGVDPSEARNRLFTMVPPEASHIALIEPDMRLVVEGSLADMLAVAPGDVLLVRTEDNGFRHRLPLLLRNRPDWVIADDVHRSVRREANFVTARFEPAHVVRVMHGGRVAHRLVRDRDRLYARLAGNPGDSSLMFRLARVLADLGETDPAIHWFTRCAGAASRGEEAYCAWYFIGEMHLLDNDFDAAESAFMWALQMRPARAEAYLQLALIHNLSRDYPRARMWAEAGMLQRADGDTMFVQPWMRRWGLPFEWAVAAWWTGDARAARSMFLSLNESNLLPQPWATRARELAARPLPGEEQLRYG